MSEVRSIAIVGGGLGGLAAANALAAVGLTAEVFEAAPALGEIGAGINTSPQAVKALQAIGLGDKIAAVANCSPGVYTRNMQTGEPLEFNDRRKTAARYGAPYYTFHRADLMDALASGARSRLDPSRPPPHRHRGAGRFGRARLRQWRAPATRTLVIGADGVHSVVRHALYGDDNPTYTGQMVWRALLKGSDVPPEVLEPTGHIQWVGPGCHLLGLLSARPRGREHRDPGRHRQMGRGRLVHARRSRRDAAELPQSRAAARDAAEHRHRMLEMGPVHAAADRELGPRPHPAHRRRGACDAAQCRPGRLPSLRGCLYPRALARSRRAIRSRRSRNFRRIRIPRVHARAAAAPSPMPGSSTCATARRRRR